MKPFTRGSRREEALIITAKRDAWSVVREPSPATGHAPRITHHNFSDEEQSLLMSTRSRLA